MIAIKIIQAISTCFYVFYIMIFARCLLTWIPVVDWENPILKGLKVSVDLYLDLFRKFIPPIGVFDISPIIAVFALMFVERAIIFVAQVILLNLGMVIGH